MNDILIDGQVEFTIIPTTPESEISVKIIAGKLRMTILFKEKELSAIYNAVMRGAYQQCNILPKLIQVKPATLKQDKPTKYITFTSTNINNGRS